MSENNTQYPETVQAMLNPDFYPEKPDRIELLQTQMSFVFLVGEYAYKLKKPVNLGYLDYSTLEKRRYFCDRELVLNRRLCPDAYLAVLPITRAAGKISMKEHGEIVDYAVKMRRLPQERMLNTLLAQDQVSDLMIMQVAQKLGEFHKQAETNAIISAFGDPFSLTTNTEENFNQTEKSVGRTISAKKYDRIKSYTRSFISDNHDLFTDRVNHNRIRDCHGDLHAAHVCFTDPVCIYDCIEFNDRFRFGDVASEIAFLAMDLDHYGRADLSCSFVDYYVNLSNDSNILELLPFYKCYRAYIRGKVESFKLDDIYISPEDKVTARDIALGYFDLASFYIRPNPTLFITVGITGTGKTTLAHELARHTGATVVSSDVIRKRLAGIPLNEHRYDNFNSGIYSSEFTQKTYNALLTQGKDILAAGRSVILDATFLKISERQRAGKLASEFGADFYILECVTDRTSITKRLDQRKSIDSVSDGRIEILEPQLKQYEPVNEVPDNVHTMIDISDPMGGNIRQIMEMLGESELRVLYSF